MSDFDEEAEREKLRKRFAEEEKERETTERMSELLLQGATMTNTHCDTCGDPLFRYDGQTFCSTCQQAVDTEPTATDESVGSAETATTDDGQRIAVDDPHDHPAGQNDAPPRSADAAGSERTESSTHDRRARPSQTADDASGIESETPMEGNRSGESVNDLAATEVSLSRTLRRQANAAEDSGDIERTRAHLAAAREAAEALEAVRTARR